ncbi:right-handed parallel beta-helix repeat-containing protein [Methanococcoides sp. FTZ1]|uniref:right-handed parallel beta-helix repeat-containing protein n=1 Tax=Methanococcoides sp. FTZ1 TaxID=3439061 RepID=UPI003F869FDF
MGIKQGILISFGIALLLMTVGTASAATITVNNSTGDVADFTSIQAAIDDVNTLDEDTILVYPGTYNENVDVYKSVNITSIDGAAATNVVAFSYEDHVFAVYADNVTISGFNASGALDPGMAGIYLDNSSNTRLSNNIAEGNFAGIVLEGICNNTMLTNNMMVENLADGIVLFETDNCVLTDNTVNDNEVGIILIFANNTILTDNIIENSSNSDIVMIYSHNNRLIGNTAANSDYGIYIDESSNNELADNTVINNSAAGIMLLQSDDTRLTSNTVSGNMEPTAMVTYGIYLSGNNSTLINNTISVNADYGLYLDDDSTNNLIYNNYFNNSTYYFMLVNYDGSSTWNSTEMVTYVYEGNTYTSYTGNYYFDYANEMSNDIDGDGIGDTAYYVDPYPLMFWPVIPVPPIVDPSDALDELKGDVDALDEPTLIKKLDGVISMLDKEEYEKAIEKLEDFIKTVERLEKRGKLTEGQAEDLIKEAEDIIKLIENLEG